MHPIEITIVEKLLVRDTAAISLIYDHYGDALYGMVFKLLKDEDLAKDAIQEGLVNVWKNSDSYDPKKGRLFTWLLNIVRNKALDKLRSIGRKPEIQMSVLGVYPEGEDHQTEVYTDNMGLHETVAKLDPGKRQLIELSFFKGYTHDEIAQNLDMPLGTVKTRIRSALKELRTILQR